jgi:hypothetical protein
MEPEMPRDGGVLVSKSFLDGPLLTVSDRALRVYLVLRAKVLRNPGQHTVEGVTVALEAGEVLLSTRTLRGIVGGGINQLLRALRELEHADLITRVGIGRRASPHWKRKRLRPGDDKRLQSGNSGRVVVTHFKLHTRNKLDESDRFRSGDERSTDARTSPVSDRDRTERARAEAVLAAEGR